MKGNTARALWELAEPVHAVTYFAAEVGEALVDAGLRGFWMSYFAARLAPLGPVSPEVATAVVYNFHPDRVSRAIPDAWDLATPEEVLAARGAGISAVLDRLVGTAVTRNELRSASEALEAAAHGADHGGRALFAAHEALPWPNEALLGVWHGCTCLREHRGDGHVAALLAAGVGPCDAHVLLVAQGRSTAELQRAARGWSEEDWATSSDSLSKRGWIDRQGALTGSGRSEVEEIERRTDEAAEDFASAVPDQALGSVAATLGTLRSIVLDAGGVPFPNPIGLTEPRD